MLRGMCYFFLCVWKPTYTRPQRTICICQKTLKSEATTKDPFFKNSHTALMSSILVCTREPVARNSVTFIHFKEKKKLQKQIREGREKRTHSIQKQFWGSHIFFLYFFHWLYSVPCLKTHLHISKTLSLKVFPDWTMIYVINTQSFTSRRCLFVFQESVFVCPWSTISWSFQRHLKISKLRCST